MARAKGTYVTLDRWVFDLAPKLPGAAGVILERLSAQSNYQQKALTVGQLCHFLPFKERAVQNAVAYLVAEGYAEAHAGAYCLRQSSASDALATRTDMREAQGINAVPVQESEELNPAIEVHNKKEEKEEKEIEEQNNKAQESAALVEAPLSQKSVAQKNTPAIASKTNAPELDTVPGGAAAPFQLLFGALALACYGGHDALTNTARSRVAAASKSLEKAGYVASDVPLIVAWIRETESWRDALTPQVIEERAPAWKQRESLPVRPKTIKFHPAPPAALRDDGEIDMDALIRNAPLNGTRR